MKKNILSSTGVLYFAVSYTVFTLPMMLILMPDNVLNPRVNSFLFLGDVEHACLLFLSDLCRHFYGCVWNLLTSLRQYKKPHILRATPWPSSALMVEVVSETEDICVSSHSTFTSLRVFDFILSQLPINPNTPVCLPCVCVMFSNLCVLVSFLPLLL